MNLSKFFVIGAVLMLGGNLFNLNKANAQQVLSSYYYSSMPSGFTTNISATIVPIHSGLIVLALSDGNQTDVRTMGFAFGQPIHISLIETQVAGMSVFTLGGDYVKSTITSPNAFTDVFSFPSGNQMMHTITTQYVGPDAAVYVSPNSYLLNGQVERVTLVQDAGVQFVTSVDFTVPYGIDLSGTSFNINLVSQVPEPSAALMLGIASAMIIVFSMRKQCVRT